MIDVDKVIKGWSAVHVTYEVRTTTHVMAVHMM